MNTDTRPIVEIIDTLFKEKRVMQRCDRCFLRNRMARIPCTLPSSDPAPRTCIACHVSIVSQRTVCLCYPSRSMSFPKTRLPRSSPHIRDLPTLRRCCPFQHCRCGGEFDFEPRRCPGRDCIRCRVNRIARRTFTFRIHGAHLDRVLCVRLEFVTRWVVFVLPVATHFVPGDTPSLTFTSWSSIAAPPSFADASHSKSMKSVPLPVTRKFEGASGTVRGGGGGGTATSRTRIVTVLSAVAAVFVLSAANNTSKSVSCDTCSAFCNHQRQP